MGEVKNTIKFIPDWDKMPDYSVIFSIKAMSSKKFPMILLKYILLVTYLTQS